MLILSWRQLDDEWNIHIDNKFAEKAISSITDSPNAKLPAVRQFSKLCNSCHDLDFFSIRGFFVKFAVDDLKTKAEGCDLCRLFWTTYQRYGDNDFDIVVLEKVDSSLRMNGVGTPVLTICRTPGMLGCGSSTSE